MSFFKRLKELSNLKKSIEHEKDTLEKLQTDIFLENQRATEEKNQIAEQINILTKQLDEKESTMNNIRSVLRAENAALQDELIKNAKIKAEKITYSATTELNSLLSSIDQYKSELDELQVEHALLQKEINRYKNQARKYKADIVGIKEFNKTYSNSLHCDVETIDTVVNNIENLLDEDGLIDSLIKLPLHSDNSKELRKLSRATRKEIDVVLKKYESRYTTKGNKAIYNLMVIGLQAEMQLLLFNLSYQKLEETKNMIEEIFTKYLLIAGKGNKSILSTITRFISEMKPLYLELINIEYRYYIKRQQEKEEQQAIREQMKQEAEERKALENERKKLEKEESKYITEMKRNEELLQIETDIGKIAQLNERLKELQSQLEKVEEKKEEVTSLTMGKAGYVYIISNVGSFGENIFKIGMTRRLEPQQRVDELGSASVPFKFDVHAMIFSDDAVNLENTLHKKLSEYRVNKVNFRKEFFKSSINDLETLVEEIDPTAEFTRTMLAEEYQQTLAIEENSQNFIA
ncbi:MULTISPECIES: GIY-YIG nuclease family protein [unclassified Enterococcus]|uniref:GIY-YIG nuclease family protein n=1 Tax=unclassified Enterococcus TaxID=2608891 RepID=UPI0019826E09|nr:MULTISPECIES: GIY-YIG nuclease family protein [unclassified Enterococcus]